MTEQRPTPPNRRGDETGRSRRLEKQAAYQKKYREAQRAGRAPSRIDVANLTLYWFVTLCLSEGNDDGLLKMRAVLIEGLARQGFDPEKAARRVDEIIERYEDGWTFRPKTHLDPDAPTLRSLFGARLPTRVARAPERT